MKILETKQADIATTDI